MQDEIFPDERHFGRIFYNQAQMSASGHPADRKLSWARAPAGAPMCRRCRTRASSCAIRAPSFSAGPPLVKAATGEVVTAEELGGADVHSRQSGVTDHYAQNDAHAIGIARRIVATLKPRPGAALNMREGTRALVQGPRHLRRRADRGQKALRCPRHHRACGGRFEFDEFKKLYGQTLICGFAHVFGYPVGIIANNGILFSESSLKGAHFIELCCQRNIRWCSCKTSRASWSARNTRPAASRATAPNW